MCNLYSMTKSRAAIVAIARAMRDRNDNQPPLRSVFPDQAAPVVFVGPGGALEMADARWGLPSPAFALKGHAVDRGVTNVRNTASPHWRRWLGTGHRCLAPFTAFAEPNVANRSENVWFALGEDRPVGWFAGVRVPGWTSVRKLKEGEITADLFGFLTCEPNAEVAPVHARAMPVILTEAWEREAWLGAPWPEAARLQRPLADGKLSVVGRGVGLREEP